MVAQGVWARPQVQEARTASVRAEAFRHTRMQALVMFKSAWFTLMTEVPQKPSEHPEQGHWR